MMYGADDPSYLECIRWADTRTISVSPASSLRRGGGSRCCRRGHSRRTGGGLAAGGDADVGLGRGGVLRTSVRRGSYRRRSRIHRNSSSSRRDGVLRMLDTNGRRRPGDSRRWGRPPGEYQRSQK